MKKLSSITCLLLLIISEIKSELVSCSSLEKEVGQEHITCIITDDINVVGVELSSYSDGSVIEIKIENNKNRFLPVKVAESFPNLKLYNAAHGSVESLSKENFKGLLKL
ncbi:CLUMA_CG011826, isoform A [Clunio marinus]|uniref:CLUMA_CG011826, isoform A n=1 Tax=Clunio marinus TaxID=568069 RepID=A0A1J1IDY8_9DIPT|nr:CLUMA_CG011826, isoform A [Clunio marinus]